VLLLRLIGSSSSYSLPPGSQGLPIHKRVGVVNIPIMSSSAERVKTREDLQDRIRSKWRHHFD
jgi:hypothetical protein